MKKQKHSIHPIFTHPFLYACMVTLLVGCPMPFQGLGITGKAPTSSSRQVDPKIGPGAKIRSGKTVPTRNKQQGEAEASRSQEVAELLKDRLEDQETEIIQWLARLLESQATALESNSALLTNYLNHNPPALGTTQLQIAGGPENEAEQQAEKQVERVEKQVEIADQLAEIADQLAEIAEKLAEKAEKLAEITVETAKTAVSKLTQIVPPYTIQVVEKEHAIAAMAEKKAVEAAEKAKSALEEATKVRTRLEAITKATNAAKTKAAEAVERASKAVERANKAVEKAKEGYLTIGKTIENLKKISKKKLASAPPVDVSGIPPYPTKFCGLTQQIRYWSIRKHRSQHGPRITNQFRTSTQPPFRPTDQFGTSRQNKFTQCGIFALNQFKKFLRSWNIAPQK